MLIGKDGKEVVQVSMVTQVVSVCFHSVLYVFIFSVLPSCVLCVDALCGVVWVFSTPAATRDRQCSARQNLGKLRGLAPRSVIDEMTVARVWVASPAGAS